MGDIDVLDMAAYVLNPANSDPGTLIALACVVIGASGLAVLWVHKRLSRRPTVEELANPDYNPHLDGPRRGAR